jgi:hypothetical protein
VNGNPPNDLRDEQFENASHSIRRNLDPPSTVTLTREEQPEKLSLQIASSDRGRKIESSEEQFWNEPRSIRRSEQSDSNVTV